MQMFLRNCNKCVKHGKSTRSRRNLSNMVIKATQPSVSDRIIATDDPVIVTTKRLMAAAGRSDVLSLAQGIVHWQPPQSAIDAAAAALARSGPGGVHGYGPAEGLPELRLALEAKLAGRNKLPGHRVMVTAGANQAFHALVTALVDEGDGVVLFKPYYFNHAMAIQMGGGARRLIVGESDPNTTRPDLDWLEAALKGPDPPKMVVLVTPCNPTGILLSQQELQRAADLCGAAGCWLVLDHTYEDFVYDGRSHTAVGGEHVLHVFSFSKAYGMMGWRIGYLAYMDAGSSVAAEISRSLLKAQDTVAICAPQLGQVVALTALQEGAEYVAERVRSLEVNRAALLDALSPLGRLGAGIAGGEGAIYLWAKLPAGVGSDEDVVAWLVREWGVTVIPGSACGAPGHIRAAYANLDNKTCAAAAARLKGGLTQLVSHGSLALKQSAAV